MAVITWTLLALLVVGLAGLAARRWAVDAGLFLLLGVSAVAIWLRLKWVPFHHIMYVDEPWYEEAARNLLRKGAMLLCEETATGPFCKPYPKAAGWPAILALAFRIGGVREHVAFVTSALLGALAAPAAGWTARIATGRWMPALLAATLLAVHPLDLIWSGTVETNAAATTFLLFGLAGVIEVRNRSSPWASAVAAGGLGVAAAIRPELWLAFIPALTVLLPRVRGLALVVFIAGAALATGPGIASRTNFETHADGPIMRWAYLGPNLRATFERGYEGGAFSAGLAGLALAGLIVVLVRKQHATAILLGGTAILIGLFVLVYYPPPGFYGRAMLGTWAPAAILAGCVLPKGWPGNLLAVVLITIACGFSWRNREVVTHVPETQRCETLLSDRAESVQLPPDALVIAEWPTILTATTDLQVMRTDKALESGSLPHRPLYFACDMFCEHHFRGQDESACHRFLSQYALEEVVSVGHPERNYGLFRVVGPAAKGAPPASCPGG